MQQILALMLEVEEEAVKLSESARDNADSLMAFAHKRISEIRKSVSEDIQKELDSLHDRMIKRAEKKALKLSDQMKTEYSLDAQEIREIISRIEQEIFG